MPGSDAETAEAAEAVARGKGAESDHLVLNCFRCDGKKVSHEKHVWLLKFMSPCSTPSGPGPPCRFLRRPPPPSPFARGPGGAQKRSSGIYSLGT